MKQIINCLVLFPAFLLADLKEPMTECYPKGNTTEVAQNQAEAVSRLPAKEKAIYDQLGPIYKKIYLSFTNEEKRRVVIFTQRGVDPYEAINSVLRVEQRKYEKLCKKKLTPKERAEQKKVPKCTILQSDPITAESTLDS